MKRLRLFALFLALSALLCACNRSSPPSGAVHIDTNGTTSAEESGPTPEQQQKDTEIAYTGFLLYEYAADAGYYTCMYLTEQNAALWNSPRCPKNSLPTQSKGYDTACTVPIDPALFAAVAKLANDVDYHLSEVHLESFYTADDTAVVESHIAALDKNGLVRSAGGIGVYAGSDPKALAFCALHTRLNAIRNQLDLQSGISPKTAEPKIVAVLTHDYGTRSVRDEYPMHYVTYLTPEKQISWSSVTAEPDIADPLAVPTGAEITEKSVSYDFESLSEELYALQAHRMPIMVHPHEINPLMDGARETVVLYREDDSRIVLRGMHFDRSCPSFNRVCHTAQRYLITATPT